MEPRRSTFAIAGACCALAVLLVACGGGEEPPTRTTEAPSLASASPAVSGGEAIQVDAAIPAYETVGGVAGSLNSIGSDTLNNLMTLWAESFRKVYPNVKIQIEGKGSSTAPPALIQGTAQIGPMSREMKASEIDEFEKRFGYQPTQIRVAIDALAVYVHRDNPLERLSLDQVDAIFSSTLKCGHATPIDTWDQAGVAQWGPKPISLYGRNSASGTYGYFKEHALCGGDYRDTVKEQPGSASVVQGVTEDVNGIGYSGIGYKTSGVKTLSIAAVGSQEYHDTDAATVLSGEYPLSRYLYLYVNKAPGQELDPLVREFLHFVLSQDGQQVVVKDGYLPLAHEMIAAERAKAG